MIDHDDVNYSFDYYKKLRKELIDSPGYKECFHCNKVLPLDRFTVNPKKFQRPAAKGRCVKCKECVKKKAKPLHKD